jgi:peptidoglycan/LPS O-acetylase OafA/YrhL
MAAGEIRAITGVRGAAAVFVMVYHFELNRIPPDNPFAVILNHGYLSVDLFFVLSGFVMALVYGPAMLSGTFNFGEFMLHRIARIYPLYIFATLAFILLSLVKSGHLDFPLTVLLSNAVLLQAIGNWPSIDPPAWSVSAEMIVYLVFPLVGVVCLRSKRTTALSVGAASFLAILCMTVAASKHYIGSTIAQGPLDLVAAPFTVIRCLAGFTIGVLAWRFHDYPGVKSFASMTAVQAVVSVLIVATLAQQGSDFVAYLLIVPLVLCLSGDRGALSAFFSSRPMQFLGTVSLGIYLVHWRALGVWAAVERELSGQDAVLRHVIASIATAAIVVFIAWLLHVAIERPCRQWVRRLPMVRTQGRHAGVAETAGPFAT